MECPQEPRAGGGREGCAAGGTERAGNSREKHTEREGGREREENQLHPHEGVMARPCPSGEAQDAELATSTSQRQCLTPAPLPGSIPAGQALCCHGDDGAVIPKRQKRKPPVLGPRWPWGPLLAPVGPVCVTLGQPLTLSGPPSGDPLRPTPSKLSASVICKTLVVDSSTLLIFPSFSNTTVRLTFRNRTLIRPYHSSITFKGLSLPSDCKHT